MSIPQFGIFAQGTHAHHFLEFDLRPGVAPQAAVASFRRLATPEVSAGGVNLVRMFGIAGDGLRDSLTDFSRAVSGAYYFAPSLQTLSQMAGPDTTSP